MLLLVFVMFWGFAIKEALAQIVENNEEAHTKSHGDILPNALAEPGKEPVDDGLGHAVG